MFLRSRRRELFIRNSSIGNLMFRYMFARHLQGFLPEFVLTGYEMPEWGLVADRRRPPKNLLEIGPIHRVDIPAVVRQAREPGRRGVDINGYAQRLEYFEGNRDAFVREFASPVSGTAIRPDEIAVHVRAGDILTGLHRDYWPMPISYYRRIVAETGLAPVFVGQIGPSPYCDAICKAFPDARYIAGQHWLDDFQTLRHAKNVAIAVSTFSWLAAWLSTTAEVICQPLLGFLNPKQRPDIDLRPRADARYRFTEFPAEAFVASREQMDRILA